MTSRELYESLLVELNKTQSCTLLLEEYNYYVNKAVSIYIDRKYNYYDVNQQLTDDLRFLSSSAILEPKKIEDYSDTLGLVYYIQLPNDYRHLTGCVCFFDLSEVKDNSCHKDNEGNSLVPCRKMTSDQIGNIYVNHYLRPSYKRPYYHFRYDIINGDDVDIHNNPFDASNGLTIGSESMDNPTRDRKAYSRYGNSSKVILDIHCGDDKRSKLKKVMVSYLKSPQNITLTQEQIDLIEDRSQLLEYPDYVCYEVINIALELILELNSNPRVQTQPQVSQSIVNPQQRQK